MKSSSTAKAYTNALLIALAVTLLVAHEASAAGLFLTPRGVRPLGRGGAFVAGADDVNALSYNPAGLAYAPRQILVDVAVPIYGSTVTRRVTPDSDPLPSVNGKGLTLPVPTLGFVHDFGLVKDLTFGASLAADVPQLQNFPATLGNGQPAPTRYSIIGYNGTAIVKLAAGAAYRVLPQLSLGMSLNALVGNFVDQKAASACDGVICTAPEDPAHDATVQFAAKNIVAPGVQFGAIVNPLAWLKIGLAWESGYHVSRDGTMKMRLPSAAEYDDASLSPANPKAHVTLNLPWTARFGIEAKNDLVRVEVAAVYDHWASLNTVTIAPKDVVIKNVLALGDYRLSNIVLQPGFRSVWSGRIGSEWTPMINGSRDLVLRLGGFIDPSAVPDKALTAEWVDLKKTFITGGVGYRFGRVLVDATAAIGFFKSRSVRDSEAQQVNPLRPPFPGRTFTGNGDYSAHGSVFGLSFRYLLD